MQKSKRMENWTFWWIAKHKSAFVKTAEISTKLKLQTVGKCIAKTETERIMNETHKQTFRKLAENAGAKTRKNLTHFAKKLRYIVRFRWIL